MSHALVSSLCNALPNAERSQPFGDGHDVWKIGGKIFAATPRNGIGVAVKCRDIDTAHQLEDMFGWPKAPYFHRSWVLVPLDTEADELRFRIETSYTLIRASLSRNAQTAFGPWPQSGDQS